ncbi:fungal protein [Schizosaccharomyces cryophilus OY26]|uniref:Fungal protein n=1 Tax=Schizosaccharomyces cryophilus (strain OY26 / ATCC MYA-4695 / CBS 11777 / NBRC 106824 / NRRL Y48691) TaxID=653667 RepID=S9W0X7_SCHCR|nr:uncharacterized protein SPOG_00130 [Schizosaccharomyces cryophilus OY26]EPY51705.1 fungal protein [Schizosaccharomyces cryophilus OY26]
MPTKTKKKATRDAERKKLGYNNAPAANEAELDDDTPKSFKRLMKLKEFSENKPKKTEKIEKKKNKPKNNEQLKRQPGESMREFSLRVNQAIPVAFKTGKATIDEFTDKKDKKKIEKHQEKRQRERDEAEKNLEDKSWEADVSGKRIHVESHKKRKGSPDPWAGIQEKPAFGETVLAPPKLPQLNLKKKITIENVPKFNSRGQPESLARRQALGQERQELIQKYRELMHGGKK